MSFMRYCFPIVFLALIFMNGCSSEEGEDIFQKPIEDKFEVIVTTTGELQAKNSIDIMGPVGARKAGIYQMKITRLVPEGTYVNQGEFVAELDKSELLGKVKEVEINLQKYQSQFTQAKLDCTLTLSQSRDEMINLKYAMEQRKLEKDESIYESPSTQRQTEIEFEKSERAFAQSENNYQTKVQQATAKMREAEADLFKEQQKYDDYQALFGEFSIAAPSNGMVIYYREYDGKKRSVGSTISPWGPEVATLPDLSKMESVTYVNEVDIQKIKKGQKVRISLDANPDKVLTGEVTQVANIGEQRPNSDSKVFEVKIEINEVDSLLRPAMTTSNQVVITSMPTALYVPLETIHTEDSLTFVYKRNGNDAIKQEVRLGLMNENHAIVEDGVTLEDELYLSIPEDQEDVPVNRLDNNQSSPENAAKAQL